MKTVAAPKPWSADLLERRPCRAGSIAVLDGIGMAVPPSIVTNMELAKRLDTSDDWIRRRTGISERRIADPAIATSDLAVEAARLAIDGSSGADIQAVVVATTTPDYRMPGVAPQVASRLHLGNIPAFDVQAACSGFIYALASGVGLIAAGIAGRVLVIGADVMSRIVDPEDRTTAVLFGDGAGAVTLRAGAIDEIGAIGPFDLGSDGEYTPKLCVERGGTRVNIERTEESQGFLSMDGGQVFRHAVCRMYESSRRVLERSQVEIGDIDWLVAHQANQRILLAVALRLGLPPERLVMNLDRYGNTSAASIPLALAGAELQPGDRVLLTAFGSGFTWGSTLLTWPHIGR